MSRHEQLQEMAQLLQNLFEAAKKLPEGADRQSAFETIDDFRKQLWAHLTPRSARAG
jgi:hypothetical protein